MKRGGHPNTSSISDVELKFERAEMQMVRWMCGVSMRDRRTSEELRKLAGVEPITTVIKSGRLRWYGHVMRTIDEDWVKKCMEHRVEGRRPVGRPTRTWLYNVEADMAEHEIDIEDIHDRNEKVCYKEEIKPNRKTDYKPIICL